jgi:hydrogenase maturation protease
VPDPDRRPAPVAVVALGDPDRHDDGVALRVLGRVRTIIGELGCARSGDPLHADLGKERKGKHRLHHALTGVQDNGLVQPETSDESTARIRPASLALAPTPTRIGLVEWIEGGTDVQKLDPLLAGRQRVVLVDSVRISGRPGQVHHWHLKCLPESRLSVVRQLNNKSKLGMQHLALWLEDELPARGTDLIGIEPADLNEGSGLSLSIRRQLPTISSKVAAILVRLLEEEGW